MNLAEIFLGQIPEALYFSLFLIFTKKLTEKRVLFTLIMIFEYLLLKSFIHFDIWFQIGYIVMTFITLKVLYKDKSQITDIFTFGIASIVLIAISAFSYFIFLNNSVLAVIINRLLTIFIPIILRNRLYKIEKLYKTTWNRSSNNGKIIKSTTLRSISLVTFNLMFVVINLGMLYALLIRR